jgi:hypothetical protein
LHAVDYNSPFYPQEIFAALDRMIRAAQRERDDLLVFHHDRFSIQWFQRGRQNFQEVEAETQNISQLIRERLEKLSVRG